MRQLFIRFPKFTEFTENSAPFRKNSNKYKINFALVDNTNSLPHLESFLDGVPTLEYSPPQIWPKMQRFMLNLV